MDYAVLEGKNPGATWERVQAKRRNKERQPDKAELRPRGQKEAAARTRILLRSLAAGTVKGVLLFIIGAAAQLGWWEITHTPEFLVTDVRLEGLQTLKQEQVLGWMGNPRGDNIFALDVQEMAVRLREHPWIRNASIERMPPHTVSIRIVERTPYARLQLEHLHLLDSFGVLLGRATKEHEHLPLIIGFPGKQVRPGENAITEPILQGLHTMHHLNGLELFRNDPVLTFQVVGNHRAQFISNRNGIRIFMDLDTIEQGFRNFRVFLNVLEQDKEIEFQTIDLSFKDKVVVTKNNNGQKLKKL